MIAKVDKGLETWNWEEEVAGEAEKASRHAKTLALCVLFIFL